MDCWESMTNIQLICRLHWAVTVTKNKKFAFPKRKYPVYECLETGRDEVQTMRQAFNLAPFGCLSWSKKVLQTFTVGLCKDFHLLGWRLWGSAERARKSSRTPKLNIISSHWLRESKCISRQMMRQFFTVLRIYNMIRPHPS